MLLKHYLHLSDQVPGDNLSTNHFSIKASTIQYSKIVRMVENYYGAKILQFLKKTVQS